ncbi:uncharacterized protein EV154DRAFT_411348 [Mucor mucedo]|uniref:uncharacterized protein n=1 Tax=Mucor mucedo TaxID=29922 RepID=UPI002220550E|nr:uncharacterized protein EV154DRAFT_411348 [Mucor mucedo]KAI7896700.1 hypothetical protein EV154DRAFT_411348 [Mucor mucedo]
MSGNNIKVVVRCRPLNSREKARGAPVLIRMEGNKTIISKPVTPGQKPMDESKAFTFDQSYWSADKDDDEYADQERVYNDLGRELLDHAFNGYNCCIFAYGQTGSGKSYSMMGYGEDKGIIPRTCYELFDRVRDKKTSTLDFQVEVSYIEIYNEKVRDLLNPQNKSNLKVREHPVLGPYVQDLSRLAVNSFDDIDRLMDEGNKARTVAATNMNETSSRSHAVFTIFVTQKIMDPATKLVAEKVARISLVDLAGSERANSTGATGQRLKEGANINKSLTTLGKVIAGLAEAASAPEPKKGSKKPKEVHVPFRDSVLTWLLKDSLGGNSKTCMIAAISPADYDETISTLRYADQAKKIKTKAVVNEDPNAKVMRELKDEVDALRQALMVYAPEEVEKITAIARPVKGNAAAAAAAAAANKRPPLASQKSKTLALPAPNNPATSKSTVVFTDALGNTTQLTKDEMVDQLQMTEKLLGDLNQTWEEKLNNTEKIHIERETTLKNLGITIEKNAVGLYTPKGIPYLINLNEDPLMSECLMYNIKPGITHVDRGVVENELATVEIERNDGSGSIRLSGTNINENHCYFENTDDIVTLFPRLDCTTMVNGMRISEPKRLKSGYRIILGDHHVFRFNNPGEALKERDNTQQDLVDSSPPSPISSEKDGFLSPAVGGSEVMDWNFARREAMLNTYINDSNFGNFTNEDLDKLFDDVAKVRVIRKRQSTSSDTLSRRTSSSSSVRRSTYSTTASSVFMDDLDGDYTTDSSTISSSSSTSSTRGDNIILLAKDEQEIQMEHHRRKYEARLRRLSYRISYMNNQSPLSFTPHERKLALNVVSFWKRQRNVAMAKAILNNDLQLRQANAMAAKLKKEVFYQFAVIHDNTSAVSVSHWDQHPQQGQKNIDIDLLKAAKPCIGIQVVDQKHQSIYIWSVEKFLARFRYLQGAYYASDLKKHMKGEDLYYETTTPPSYVLAGLATVPLRNLATQVPVESTLAIHCHNTGQLRGTLRVLIAPIARSVRHPYRSDPSEDGQSSVSSEDENPRSLLHVGQQLVFEISIIELIGVMDPKEFSHVHAQFRLSTFGNNLDGVFASDPVPYTKEKPIVFNYHQTLSMAITQDILQIIETKSIAFEVFAKPQKEFIENLSPISTPVDTEVTPVTKTQDVIAHIQICEITPDGDYKPVPVESLSNSNNSSNNNNTNAEPSSNDVFSLQQGQQRRVIISLKHQGEETRVMPLLEKISDMRIGQIRLIDGKNRPVEQPQTGELSLNLISSTSTPSHITVNGAWDSSLHDTLLLNAITPNNHKVILTLSWTVRTTSGEAIRFEKELYVHIKDQSKAANIKKKSASANPNKRGSVILNFFSLKSIQIKSQVTCLFAIHCKPDLYSNMKALVLQPLPAHILDIYHRHRPLMTRRQQVDDMRYTVFLAEQLDRMCNVEPVPCESPTLDAQSIVNIWSQTKKTTTTATSLVEIAPPVQPSIQKWVSKVSQIIISEDCKSKKAFLSRRNDADGKAWDKYWCSLMG